MIENTVLELIDQLVNAGLEIVVGAVVAFVGYYLTRAAKAFESSGYAKALKDFDSEIFDTAVELARAVVARGAKEAAEIPDSELYDEVRSGIVETIDEVRARTGIKKTFGDKEFDALVQRAVEIGRVSWNDLQRGA